MKRTQLKKNRGVYSIEFVLISALFLFTIFMLLNLSRIMYLMNAASEVTRRGARVAVVCDKDADGIFNEMSARFPNLVATNVNVTYLPAGCTQATCETVTVSLTGVTDSIIGITVNFPNFSTTLPRESMDSTLNPTICS